MPEIPPDIETQLAGMTDGEWSAFTARVRAPDTAEAFRTAAAKHVSGQQLDSLCSVVDVSKFTGADGQVDAQRVSQFLTAALGGPPAPGAPARRFGQTSAPDPNGPKPGDTGRAAAAKRFGTPPPESPLNNHTWPDGPGAQGRAAAARRYPQKGNQ